MKYIFSLVINFSFSMLLFGMDIPSENKSTALTLAHHLDIINRNVVTGTIEYEKGNIKEAGILLFGAYNYAEYNSLLPYIQPGVLQRVYNIISITQDASGNFERALEFAHKISDGTNNTDKGIIYRHMAKKAGLEGDFTREQECYQTAFRYFQGSALKDPRAAKYYEHALYNGIGCTYSISDIRKHHLEQLKIHYSQQTIGRQNRYYKHNLKKLVQLAENNMVTKCTLAKMYTNQKDTEKYGLTFSYQTSLQWCESAIINLAKEISSYSTQLFILSTALEQLRNHPDYEEKATILQKYFDILSALKNKTSVNTKMPCWSIQHNQLSSAITQIMSLQTDDDLLSRYIQSIFFDDDDFIQFCTTEGSVAIPILMSLMQNISMDSKTKDLFHRVIGGYEYRQGNYSEAEKYLSQCSYYKKDVYLQAINLPIYISEENKEKIHLFFSLFQQKLNSQSSPIKIQKAKKIVANLCHYNSSESAENKLSFCKQFLFQFIALPTQLCPLEQLRFFMSLNDMCQHDTEPGDIQKKATIIQIYFDFLSALYNSNQQKLNALLFSPIVLSAEGRSTFFKALSNNKKDVIKTFIFENEAFRQLCSIDGFILTPILENILQNPQPLFKIKPHQCHYILGGIAFIKEDLPAAREHFLACIAKAITMTRSTDWSYSDYKNDLYIQAKLFETSSTEKSSSEIIKILPAVIKQSDKNERNNKAIQSIHEKCKRIYPEFIKTFLLNKQYSTTYEWIDAGITLPLPSMYPMLCDALLETESNVVQESQENYSALLHDPNRLNIISTIDTITKQTDHDEYWCNGLASIFEKHMQRKPYDSEHESLQKKCLHYLSCNLSHKNCTNTAEQKIKQIKYSEIAYELGTTYNSHFLDQAIEYGNARAIRKKALLLASLPQTKGVLDQWLALLEQHSKSKDPERSLSLEELGKYYAILPGIENEKKAFSYFNQAAEMGNDNVGKELALFYCNGIREQSGEWFLPPNIKKAEEYVTKIITCADTASMSASFIRAQIYYNQNQLKDATNDIESLLELEKNLKLEDRTAIFWLSGIIKLKAGDNLYDIVLCLNKINYLLEQNNTMIDKLKIDKEALKAIMDKIDAIIKNNITDSISLCFCYLIGKIFFIQSKTIETIKQSKAIETIKQFAIKCLEYAAKNNHLEAQFIIAETTNDEVKLCDKIYYLETSLYNNPDLKNIIQPKLNSLYPKNALTQAGLIIHFVENEAPFLKKYILQLYNTHSPLIDPHSFTILDPDQIKAMINDFLKIQCIKQNADLCVTNKKESTSFEYFCAIISGSLFCYSYDIQQLIAGARYLEACCNYNPSLDECIKTNLGYIYYKLGSLHIKEPNVKPLLSLLYLQKGCALNNIESIILLSKLWLDKKIDRTKITAETILQNLKTARSLDPENEKIAQVLEHCENMYVSKNSSLNSNVLSAINNVIDSNVKTLIDLNTQREHQTYPLLVHIPEILINCQSLSYASLSMKESVKIQIYKQLADKEQPDAYACFHLALLYSWSPDKSQHKFIKDYMCKGLIHGIIKLDKSNALFRSLPGLNLFCQVITYIIENNISQKWTFLSLIRRQLDSCTLNLVAFQEYFNEFYKKDLSKYPAWNVKK